MLAAGQLRIEDFYSEPDKVSGQLQPALRFILADPELSPYLSSAILKAEVAVQQAFVLLYERATGRMLIRGRVPADEIVARHRALTQRDSENGPHDPPQRALADSEAASHRGNSRGDT
jgi:hypothetical protein